MVEAVPVWLELNGRPAVMRMRTLERVPAEQAEGRRHVLASGCGAVSTFLAEPATVAPRPVRGHPPELDRLRVLFKVLFARGEPAAFTAASGTRQLHGADAA